VEKGTTDHIKKYYNIYFVGNFMKV